MLFSSNTLRNGFAWVVLFKKGFIKAEVISYSDFVNHGGEQNCKEKGKLRLEGKEYVVEDGDIIHFKFNL